MSEKQLKAAATGDSFITRPLPAGDRRPLEFASLMKDDHVRISNLEVVVRRDEGFPSAQSGGTWATTLPGSLEDLKVYGFNALTWANNHTLDYSYGGLSATRNYLNASGWAHAGAGENLPEASAPCYLDTPAGRVACLAATSTFHESWMAGNPRPDIGGRPGVNFLRHRTVYQLADKSLNAVRQIAEHSGINDKHWLRVKEGFARADAPGLVRLGSHLFAPLADGGREGEVTQVHKADKARLQKSVETALAHADWVIVALHSHEMGRGRKDYPADFLFDYARACIDAGAHAVVGHGPHVLRGIEIYRGRPIFYSLGNFIFQNETVPYLPADFYENYGIDPAASTAEALEARSDHGRLGLGVNPKVWTSVLARWSMRRGNLETMELHPIALGFGLPPREKGWPELTRDRGPLEEIVELSRELGTDLKIKNGCAVLG